MTTELTAILVVKVGRGVWLQLERRCAERGAYTVALTTRWATLVRVRCRKWSSMSPPMSPRMPTFDPDPCSRLPGRLI